MIRVRHRALRDERGSIAIITAVSFAMLAGFAALTIDFGSWYLAKRRLQAATDMAALSGTYGREIDIVDNPQSTLTATVAQDAATMLASNGFGGAMQSSTTGLYCPDSTLPLASRFTTPAAGTGCTNVSGLKSPNAVRVVAQAATSPILSGLMGIGVPRLGAAATAARVDEAGFTVASTTATANPSVNNALLSALLGCTSCISLSAGGYSALANANVNMLTFLNALALRTGVTAGTYGGLLSSNLGVGTVLAAEADALNNQNTVASLAAASAVTALAASVTGNPSVSLASVLNLGVWQQLPVNGVNQTAALVAGVNPLSLLTAALEAANGTSLLTLNLTTGIPASVAAVTLRLRVLQPPQYVFGPVGVTATDAQVQLQLGLSLIGILNGISNVGQAGTSSYGCTASTSTVCLPITINVGQATGTLSSIQCATNPVVTISATSAGATAVIGTYDSNNNYQPAPLVYLSILGALSLVELDASATTTIAGSGPTTLTYTYVGPPPATPTQTIPSAGSQTTTPIGSLAPNLSITTQAGLLSKLIPTTTINALTSTIRTLISGTLAPVLDPIVTTLLNALGIRLGVADVTLNGVACGVPMLVQ